MNDSHADQGFAAAEQCASTRRLKETHPEPTVPSVMRGVGKGIAPEIVARLAEGLRKAGLPEE